MKKIYVFFVLMASLSVQCEQPVVKTPKKEADWITYQNFKYGYNLSYPSDWKVDFSLEGIGLTNGDNHINVKALSGDGISSLTPLDEYVLQVGPLNYPQLTTPSVIDTFVSSTRVEGISVTWNGHINAPKNVQQPKTTPHDYWFVYYPSLLVGDVNSNCIELRLYGKDTTTFLNIAKSFNYNISFVTQEELLSQKLVNINEVPRPYFHYLGKTSGYKTDFDGDGNDELLIVGIGIKPGYEYETGFIRIMEFDGTAYRTVFKKNTPYNSIQPDDVKIVNLSNRKGRDVFLRFWDYRNQRGRNINYLIFFKDGEYHLTTFKEFTDTEDIGQDGIDEVVVNDLTYFSQSLTVSWYRIFVLEDTIFIERTEDFKDYYKKIIIPRYKEQLKTIESEMYVSGSIRHKNQAFASIQQLKKYIDDAKKIAGI